MKIFEFRPGIGTFSAGFEYFGNYKVVSAQKITPQEVYSYNSTHKNGFKPSKTRYINVPQVKKHEMAILRPDFGFSSTQKRAKSIEMSELWSCLAYIHEYRPKIAIIITPPGVIPYLNQHTDYVSTENGLVSKDIVIASMQKSDYMTWEYGVNALQCGVPLDATMNYYIGVRSDVCDAQDIGEPGIWHGVSNGKLPYTTIGDALGDMPLCDSNNTYSYSTPPQNSYQAWCRQRKTSSLTLNNFDCSADDTTLKMLESVVQGSSLRRATGGKIHKGKRAVWDRYANLGKSFHLIRGSGACLHPLCPRAFTIREGMRLHGLPDHIQLATSLSQTQQAEQVHEAISPLVGINIAQIFQTL